VIAVLGIAAITILGYGGFAVIRLLARLAFKDHK
jgi:hypothetical protein